MSANSHTKPVRYTSIRLRFLSIACILTILSAQFVSPEKSIAFSASRTSPVIVSAPPEAFAVGGDEAAISSVNTLATAIAGSFVGLFAPAKVPEGLTVPEPPSLSKRAVNGVASALELVSPSAKAANVSAEEPQPFSAPVATVPFDFDNDGKADIGRWHSSNTEFKV